MAKSSQQSPPLKFGMVTILILTLAVSGLAIILLNLLGLAQISGFGIPVVEDYRPLLISSLGLIILGLTPIMIQLVVADLKKDNSTSES